MAPRRHSAVFIWSDRALFVGGRSETAVHAHHATEMSLALDARGVSVGRPGGPVIDRAAGVVVRSDAPHELRIPGPEVAVLYLDKRSPWGAGVERWLGAEPLRALPPALVERYRAALRRLFEPTATLESAGRVVAALVGAVVPQAPAPRIDRRIRQALELLAARLHDPPRRQELAAAVGLSSSRLGHLFSEQVGLPVRRYLLWMRLRAALTEALHSGDMSSAAMAAGFADHAHFTRTCRRMFGLPPTAFAPVDAVFIAPA